MYDEAKWDHPLAMAGSENRAPVLLAALLSTPEPEGKRALLTGWFSVCEALRPWAVELREQARLAGYFTDAPDEPVIEAPVTVYRGAWEDDDTSIAISWTLKRETAEFFCRMISGPRGAFLGMHREDVVPHVYQATATEVLGYLNGRDEAEVVVGGVEDVEPIAALVTVPKEVAG